jgi:galactitol-specific phosphotransferase system IIB component
MDDSPDSEETKLPNENRISKDLEKVLNSHGFSFQYAVVKRAEELSKERTAHVRLEGTEIPVGLGNDSTHIDLVLQTIGRWQRDHHSTYIVGECKRVDPAKARWCFAKSPFTWRNSYQTDSSTQFDTICKVTEGEGFEGRTVVSHTTRPALELAFELKTHTKGDGTGTNYKSEITNAVSQVLRGSRGYIHYLSSLDGDSLKQKMGEYAIFIPAIFTTAELYITKSDISKANLVDGKIAENSVEVESARWIWFNYNRSLNLSHNIPINKNVNTQYDRYFRDFSRSIAIVSPAGIDEFFKTDFDSWLR